MKQYFLILILLASGVEAKTVTLTATEPLDHVPEGLVYTATNGATSAIILYPVEVDPNGKHVGTVFIGDLTGYPVGTCGDFSLPSGALCDLAGNCGNTIESGAHYCHPSDEDWTTENNVSWRYLTSGEILEATHKLMPGHDGWLVDGANYRYGDNANGVSHVAYTGISPGQYRLTYKWSAGSDRVILTLSAPVKPTPTGTPSSTPTNTPTVTPTPDVIEPRARMEVR